MDEWMDGVVQPVLIIITDQYVSCHLFQKILENVVAKHLPSILTSHFVFNNNNQKHQKLLIFKFPMTL